MIFCAWSSTEVVKRVDEANVDQIIREIRDGVDQAAAEVDAATLKEHASIPRDQLTAEQNTLINEALERTVERLGVLVKNMKDDLRPTMRLQQSKSELLMYRIGAGLGAVIAAIGIAAWYFLHQRYQDAILRRQFATSSQAAIVEAERVHIAPVDHLNTR